MSISENIAAKLKATMIEKNLTILELSKELGIAKSSTQGYLQAAINPRADTIEWLSKNLGCSLSELVSGQRETPRYDVLPDLFELAVQTQGIHPRLIPLVVSSYEMAKVLLRISDELYKEETLNGDRAP